MQTSLAQFQDNFARAQSLSGIANSLIAVATTALDPSDIYRASLVLGVSALDHFVHEFVRLGMLEVYRGKRPATDAYLSFKVPLQAFHLGIANAAEDDWLDATIRKAHSWLSFQHPDKISDAIRLISAEKLWESIAAETGSDAKAVKDRLTAIVDRRNKIAHEADMDPTNPGQRWPISRGDVEDALKFIDQVVRAIYKLIV